MAKVRIDQEQCKGCSLCTVVCPKKVLELSHDTYNKKGYHTVVLIDNEGCISCGMCTQICPDCAILLNQEKK